MPTPTPPINRDSDILLRHGYKLGNTIGNGAFAKVKLAQWRHKKGTKTIAVKIIDIKTASKDFQEKFMPRELDIWPKLIHKNIIQVYSRCTIGSRTYVFMEYAENGDVTEYLRENGAVPEIVARHWTYQLVLAVAYCHREGIAHRDVKCENLLIDSEMNIKLSDFGFARYCIDKKFHRRTLSMTFCGSAAYVAPEVLDGRPYNPFRSDVWSIGICSYIMLNNYMPFDDSNLERLHQEQLMRKWSFVPEVKVSLQGKDFVKKTLEPQPLKRCTSYALNEHIWLKNCCFRTLSEVFRIARLLR